jgi:hypothetical protein
VNNFDQLAKKLKVYNMTQSGQLPCLILFEDGKEKLRFPPLDTTTGQIGRVIDYKEKELIKYFDLDQRHLATRDIGIEKKKGKT